MCSLLQPTGTTSSVVSARIPSYLGVLLNLTVVSCPDPTWRIFQAGSGLKTSIQLLVVYLREGEVLPPPPFPHNQFSSPLNSSLRPVLPPYIPSVTGLDDTSNVDVFEPAKEDRFPDLPSRDRRGFLGKSLPFIGFTFTRYNSTADIEFTDRCADTSRE